MTSSPTAPSPAHRDYVALTEDLVLLEGHGEYLLAHVPSRVLIPLRKWQYWLLRLTVAHRGHWIPAVERRLLEAGRAGLKPLLPVMPWPSSEVPLRLIVEVTGDCNLHCTFCPDDAWINSRCYGCRRYPTSTSQERELTPAQWNTVLFDAFSAGCSVLEIRGGEALLRRNLVIELLEYARHLGFRRSVLWTNGLLLDRAFVEELRALDLTVKYIVQVVGTSEELHDTITNTTGKFGTLLENISYLAAAEQLFSIVVPVLEANHDHKDAIQETLSMLGVDDTILQPISVHLWDGAESTSQVTVNWRGEVFLLSCDRRQPAGNVRQIDLTEVIWEAQRESRARLAAYSDRRGGYHWPPTPCHACGSA